MACVRKRRDRWVIDFYNQDGVRRWKTMPKGTTKSKANEELGKIEEQVRCASYIPAKEIPKFKELAEQWIDVKASSGIRDTTIRQYKGHIENHLNPYFASVKTNQINIVIVERFIKDLSDSGVYANTIRKILTTLSSIMKYAAHPKRSYAPYNPVPDAENKPEKIKQEADMITVQECKAIMDKMSYVRDKLMVLTGALGGLRLGEIFGLQWDDIQWQDFQVFIRRTFNHGRFYPPKIKTSVRLVDMDEWKYTGTSSENRIEERHKSWVVPSIHFSTWKVAKW